jgi:hypothetical protein
MAKTHTLYTLEDILRLATMENRELLVGDLAHLIYMHAKLKTQMSKKRYKELIIAPVKWTNDGEVGIKTVTLNGVEIKKRTDLPKIQTDEEFVNSELKKAVDSFPEKWIHRQLQYLIHSLGEYSVIDREFYKRHIENEEDMPPEVIKQYKENLIEVLTHDEINLYKNKP